MNVSSESEEIESSGLIISATKKPSWVSTIFVPASDEEEMERLRGSLEVW